MKLPVTAYIVMMHHADVGTFAPAFPNLDDAIEFSNAMRLVNDELCVAEPVPLVSTVSPGVSKVLDWVDH
jgi:hypothetical protein